MATIQDYLNQIKNAIYGKDVRQAIHDGIQQCYYDGKAGAIDLEARHEIDSLISDIAIENSETIYDSEIIGNETVILSKNVSNFDFLDIYWRNTEDQPLGATRIRSVNGTFHLNAPQLRTNIMSMQHVTVTINGTSFTTSDSKMAFITTEGTSFDTGNTATIYRVVGIKSNAATPPELSDIRNGADGESYTSAGEAVRKQFTNLKSDFEYIVGEQNLLDGASITQGYVINASGNTVSITGGAFTSLIPVTEQEYILRWATTSPNNIVRIHGYDSEGNWVKQLAYSNTGAPITFYGSGINSVRISYYMPEHRLICLSEAETVSDKIDATRNEVDDLKIESKALPSDYEIGGILSDDGTNAINAKRLRTINYLSPLVEKLEIDSAYSFCVFAYTSEGIYVGVLNKDGTYTTDALVWVKERVLPLNSTYKFRIVLKKDTDTENVSNSIAEKLVYSYTTKYTSDAVGLLKQRDISLLNDNKLYVESFFIGGINVTTGEDYEQPDRVRTDFIRVYPNTDVIFESQDPSIYANYYVAEYDANKNYIGRFAWSNNYSSNINGYIRLICKKADDSNITDTAIFDSCISVRRNFASQLLRYVNGDFAPYYKADAYEAVALSGTNISYIYNRYDALVTAYPENVSRNLLGYATNADGGDDTTRPIYEYVFKTDADSNATMDAAPTILLQSGTHGNEKSSVYGLLLFMEKMWNSNNDSLISVKSNFNIRVIPILNPYGYDANTRNNRRNVNINRNFGYRWDETADTYKGSEPYSEKETQVLRDWVEANKSAFLFVDYHNMGDYDPYVSYINTPCKTIQEIYTSFIRRTTDEWRSRFYPDRKGNVYGWVNNDLIPCTYNEAYYEAGIYLSCTLEIAWDNEGTYYDATVIQTSMEQITNFVLAMIDCCRQ